MLIAVLYARIGEMCGLIQTNLTVDLRTRLVTDGTTELIGAVGIADVPLPLMKHGYGAFGGEGKIRPIHHIL